MGNLSDQIYLICIIVVTFLDEFAKSVTRCEKKRMNEFMSENRVAEGSFGHPVFPESWNHDDINYQQSTGTFVPFSSPTNVFVEFEVLDKKY